MVQEYSKLTHIPVTGTIKTTCINYVHPWTESCLQGISGLYLYAIRDSLRIYGTVYMLALLMKGRIPTLEDLKKTILGILQSTAFLSGTGFGYSLFLCLLRKLLGHFNILTVSAIPAFLSSCFAILIERPSRRTLLCLYVSNVATETLWNMALSRNMVRNIKYGNAAIFSIGMSILLYYYKAGFHKNSDIQRDPMFGVLRFVVGPWEEHEHCTKPSEETSFYRQRELPNIGFTRRRAGNWENSKPKNSVFHLVSQTLKAYKKIVHRIKCCGRHNACVHPFSCLYYTLQGVGKMFSIGLAIQIALKLVLNSGKISSSPSSLRTILFKRQTLNLATFLGGFAGVFRATLCILRRITNKDHPLFAIPAGLIAGISFTSYPDTTVSLYVVWKVAQITYLLGINKGVVPRVPGFTEFLYCLSTAILFHAALLEPTNLRPSYWKFLHSISGGRIACMNREPLNAWGLGASESLERVLQLTKTQMVLK